MFPFTWWISGRRLGNFNPLYDIGKRCIGKCCNFCCTLQSGGHIQSYFMLCVCVCVYICVYIYIYILTIKNTHTHPYILVYIYIYLCTSFLCVCMCTRMVSGNFAKMMTSTPRSNRATQLLTVPYDGAFSPNISVRMAWISFGALPKTIDDISRLDVVEIARVAWNASFQPVLQEKTCNSAQVQTPLSNDAIDSVLRHWEVGRAKDLSAHLRILVMSLMYSL